MTQLLTLKINERAMKSGRRNFNFKTNFDTKIQQKIKAIQFFINCPKQLFVSTQSMMMAYVLAYCHGKYFVRVNFQMSKSEIERNS